MDNQVLLDPGFIANRNDAMQQAPADLLCEHQKKLKEKESKKGVLKIDHPDYLDHDFDDFRDKLKLIQRFS